MNGLGTLVGKHLAINEWVSFWTGNSSLLVYRPILRTAPVLITSSASSKFRKSKVWTLQHVVLFHDIWGILHFHMNFRLSLSISVKQAAGFCQRQHWLCRINHSGECCPLNIRKSSEPQTRLSFHLPQCSLISFNNVLYFLMFYTPLLHSFLLCSFWCHYKRLFFKFPFQIARCYCNTNITNLCILIFILQVGWTH